MGYKLKKKENASSGVRRILREEIDEALELLADRSSDAEETVHEVRKHFKKIRAAVRLVRDEIGDEIYRQENRAVRDLGRRLASARDASVRVSALDRLRKMKGNELPEQGISEIRRRLGTKRRTALARLRRGSILSGIARELRALRRRVRVWTLSQAAFPLLEPGLRRAYRRGRAAQTQAEATRSDEDLHEWRKQAKELRYHVELLEPIWPGGMKELEKTLHELTDCLGDDHDFAELRRVLTSSSRWTPGETAVDAVVRVIDLKRGELQGAARPLAERIYSEKPKAFTRRMGAYWSAWRSGSDE